MTTHTHVATYIDDPTRRRQLGRRAQLLAGLVLNATLGWSWADPIAGLVIAAVAVREGLEAWRGEGCACGPTLTDQVTLEVTANQGCVDDCCHDT